MRSASTSSAPPIPFGYIPTYAVNLVDYDDPARDRATGGHWTGLNARSPGRLWQRSRELDVQRRRSGSQHGTIRPRRASSSIPCRPPCLRAWPPEPALTVTLRCTAWTASTDTRYRMSPITSFIAMGNGWARQLLVVHRHHRHVRNQLHVLGRAVNRNGYASTKRRRWRPACRASPPISGWTARTWRSAFRRDR